MGEPAILTPTLLVMPIYATIWEAVAADTGAILLVVANGLRALQVTVAPPAPIERVMVRP